MPAGHTPLQPIIPLVRRPATCPTRQRGEDGRGNGINGRPLESPSELNDARYLPAHLSSFPPQAATARDMSSKRPGDDLEGEPYPHPDLELMDSLSNPHRRRPCEEEERRLGAYWPGMRPVQGTLDSWPTCCVPR